MSKNVSFHDCAEEEKKRKCPVELVKCNEFFCDTEKLPLGYISVEDSAPHQLREDSPLLQVRWRWGHARGPRHVMVIGKHFDPEVRACVLEVSRWLIDERDVTVYVQSDLRGEIDQSRSWDNDSDLAAMIDFIVCIGGDGTILYTSTLFPKYVPPCVCFNMGSLGFLASFDIDDFRATLDKVIRGDFEVTLRRRLLGLVFRSEDSPVPVRSSLSSSETRAKIDKDLPSNSTQQGVRNNDLSNPEKNSINGTKMKRKKGSGYPEVTAKAVNELVIDRGPGTHMVSMELHIDGHFVTMVQADGIIIATATGSTAYSLSAGGSMMHPKVAGIILTPICPHTLSFRPLVLPDSAHLRIVIPKIARSTVWVSFDGGNRLELHPGDCIAIELSRKPFPTVTKSSDDWYKSLARCLNWNVRQQQKPLPPEYKEKYMGTADSAKSAL